jgi:hypothetical protein
LMQQKRLWWIMLKWMSVLLKKSVCPTNFHELGLDANYQLGLELFSILSMHVCLPLNCRFCKLKPGRKLMYSIWYQISKKLMWEQANSVKKIACKDYD